MFFGCENISFEYGKQKVLNDINLEFKKGEFCALVGNNGSGKSTLMKILCGIMPAKSGKIFLEDCELDEKLRIKVGYIFQNPENQIVGVTIEEDVAFGLENIGVPREEMENKITESLEIVGLLAKRKNDPNTLSGGQKQRLAIASIVAMEPDVILMDEPTTMLDPVGRQEVYSVIKKLVEMQKTVIIASHHSSDFKDIERVIALKNGKVFFDGSKNEFFSKRNVYVEKPVEYRIKEKLGCSYKELEEKLCR